jgi:TetR/AcrR family fatty acid metabolism transcriptional regulator
VLYHFAGKEELLQTLVMETFLASVPYMVPPVRAEKTAKGKLAAYIRANGRFIDENRTAALAMYEMFIGYRSPEGKRLDQVMAESVAANPPQGELAELDPVGIFELGRRTAVMFLVRDKEFDVIGYCEELVTIFENATKEGEP